MKLYSHHTPAPRGQNACPMVTWVRAMEWFRSSCSRMKPKRVENGVDLVSEVTRMAHKRPPFVGRHLDRTVSEPPTLACSSLIPCLGSAGAPSTLASNEPETSPHPSPLYHIRRPVCNGIPAACTRGSGYRRVKRFPGRCLIRPRRRSEMRMALTAPGGRPVSAIT